MNRPWRRLRRDVLGKTRISPSQHFRNGAFAIGISSVGMDDLVTSQMQFAGSVFAGAHFDKDVPGSGERENSDVIKREIAKCATRCSCLLPGTQQRLYGGAEFHEFKWFFQKLQCTISSALCHESRRDIGNKR